VTKIESRPPWEAPKSEPPKSTTRVALKSSPTKAPSRVTLRTAKLKPIDSKPSATTVRLGAAAKQKSLESKTLATTVRLGNTAPTTVRLRSIATKHPQSSLRPHRVLNPAPIGPDIHRQKQLSSNDADDEKNETLAENLSSNNDGDEMLEERIRLALSTPATLREVDNSANIKSVRWDPAIVSCGPVTPNSSPSCKASKSTQSPRKPASPPSKRRDASKDFFMESLARLKKRDKDTLRRLLEELTDTESENENITESYSEQRDSGSAPDSNSAPLNFEAPAPQKYATLKAQIAQQKSQAHLGKATLTLPRKRPHIGPGNSSPQTDLREPTWVNIFNPPPQVALPQNATAIPKLAPNILHPDSLQAPPGFPPHLRLPNNPSATCWNDGIPGSQKPLPNGLPGTLFAPLFHPMDPPQPIWLPIPNPPPCGLNNLPQFGYWVNPFGFQTPQPAPQPPPQPAASRAPSTISRRPFKPKGGGKGPMIDVGPEFLPSEEEPGRVARAIESGWAKSLLVKFREKYPQTGTVKAGPSAPGKMRQAAAIQQRLEFILYHQKERSAGQRSIGLSQPPCYEIATGEKIAFTGDERVANSEKNPSMEDKNAASDKIAREPMIMPTLKKKQALAHCKCRVTIGEENTAKDQRPANVLLNVLDDL